MARAIVKMAAQAAKKKKPVKVSTKKASSSKKKKYQLNLYITGTTPKSQNALANIKRICEDHLREDYELQVIDIYQSPELAKIEQIVATPTLVKTDPAPLRRLIGDFSDEARVLLVLEVKPK